MKHPENNPSKLVHYFYEEHERYSEETHYVYKLGIKLGKQFLKFI